MAATYVLSGLKFEAAVISQLIRRDVMRESVTYQAILEEGRGEEAIANHPTINPTIKAETF
ncbi:hypothetical protein ACKFKG_06435 [Phormidesmis sp. 146-35]